MSADEGPDTAASHPDDLVEPQGVNAGSEAPEEAAPAPEAAADVTAGGAPEEVSASAEQSDPPSQLLGVPDQDAEGPGQELSVGEG